MKKVVVIGGGFAGSIVAKLLESRFNVVLIDTKSFFEFTPSVLRTIVVPNHIKKIQTTHSSYLRKSKIIIGEVSEVSDKFVKIRGKKISFDYLIVTSGSSYSLPIKEKNIVNTARASHLKKCYNQLCKSKNVSIIGGGLVGVELAAEILTHYDDKKVTIIQSQDKLMPRNTEKSILYSTNWLKNKGARILFNEKVVRVTKNFVFTDKGTKINSDITFLCTGISPNYNFMKKYFSEYINEKNQIIVNDYLQIPDYENIFVAGDVNSVNIEKTAQNAEHQAKTIVKNVLKIESGKNMKKFISKKTPFVISLGKYDGIFDSDFITFFGIVPAILKRMIEKIEMWKRRSFIGRVTF